MPPGNADWMPWIKLDEDENFDCWPGVVRMPWEVGRSIMPFHAFPAEKQAELDELANASSPPPKWLNLGLCQITSRGWWEWYARRGRFPDEDASRPGIPRRVREAVLLRDLGICGVCGDPIGRDDDYHLDHVVPHSRGGATTAANLQVAHAICNLRKGARA